MFKDIYSSVVLVLTISSAIVNVVPTISLISYWKRLYFSDVLLLNIFITNLMLGIGYVLPLQRYFAGHSALPSSYCNFTGYFVFFLACTNIYTMEALSIHRFILMKKPLLIERFKMRRDIGVVINVIMWIIGPSLPILPYILPPDISQSSSYSLVSLTLIAKHKEIKHL